MDTAADNQILYPVFAMFALVVGVMMRMVRLRFGAVGRGEMDGVFYRTYQGSEEPEPLRIVTRHFINLFEVPMMFYVVVILTRITHQVSPWMVGCAWTYVATRYLHSFVHLGSNDVLTRVRVFMGSGIVLVVMWVSLLLRLLSAG